MSYVSYKDRKAFAADLKTIYQAATEAEAEQALIAFPPDIRKVIYTTKAIESLNMTLRKVSYVDFYPLTQSTLQTPYLSKTL